MITYTVHMLVPDRFRGEGFTKTSLTVMANNPNQAKERAINFLGIDNDVDFISQVTFTDFIRNEN